jgi:hypothetical protein
MRIKSTVILIVAVSLPGAAARLTPQAAAEFDRYARQVEARIGQSQPLLGERVQPVNGGTRDLPGALLHHWVGAALVPGATPVDMLRLLRDYAHLPSNYAPQILSARVLEQRKDTARLAIRLQERKVITIVIDAEYEVESGLIDADRGFGYSRGRHFWEVDSPGTPHEHRRKEGNDDGFLWRLNSYWTFSRVPEGLRIQCEAVSLTRDVPFGLDWLIQPFIEDLPRETLEFTLDATKKALMKEGH